MAALNFPNAPAAGDKYPQPPQLGQPVYTFDGEKWTTIPASIGGGSISPPSTILPLMDGVAAVGTSINFTREDHVHPIDTSRAPATAIPVAATAAEYIANSAPTKMLTPAAIWTTAIPVVIVDNVTVAPDLSLGSDFLWTPALTGRTLANPTNGKPGQKGSICLISNSQNVTAWGTAYKFPGGLKPVMTGTTLITYMVAADGTTLYCSGLVNLS